MPHARSRPNDIRYDPNAEDLSKKLVDPSEVYGHMSYCLQYPQCMRLWIFWDGLDEMPSEYISQPREAEE